MRIPVEACSTNDLAAGEAGERPSHGELVDARAGLAAAAPGDLPDGQRGDRDHERHDEREARERVQRRRRRAAGVRVDPHRARCRSPDPDERNALTTKSSIEIANTMIALATIAGTSSGSSAIRTACSCVAPRSRAACSISGPIESSRPRTMITTKVIEKVMCPIACAGVPNGTKVSRFDEDEQERDAHHDLRGDRAARATGCAPRPPSGSASA